MLQTTETKQADSQLNFAPKIIKIHLLVFENELIECHASSQKKTLRTRILVMYERFMHAWGA